MQSSRGTPKTLTAAYLIGIKGTKRDAVLLGLSVALTHSLVVIALSATALWIGREGQVAGTEFELMSGWHCLRHSFISICVARGIDWPQIAEWVGHVLTLVT